MRSHDYAKSNQFDFRTFLVCFGVQLLFRFLDTQYLPSLCHCVTFLKSERDKKKKSCISCISGITDFSYIYYVRILVVIHKLHSGSFFSLQLVIQKLSSILTI